MAVDYTQFSAQGPDQTKRSTDAMWWKKSGDEAAAAVSSVLVMLRDQTVTRQTANLRDARLYGNMASIGFFGSLANPNQAMPFTRERVTYNIVQSVVDTVTNRFGKNKVKPEFLTNNGDYREQRKAKKLNKFVEGVFYENRAYDKGPIAFRDGAVWGDGIIKVFEKDKRVCWERVMAGELVVDELEGYYGRPRQMHHVRAVDRGVLMQMFPDKKGVIRDATPSTIQSFFHEKVADLVVVRESWHLPSGPGAKDGKHFLSIDGHALTPVETWEHDFFPFARFQWSPRLYGYWGQGLAEQLHSIQLEVNKLLQLIQRSYHLGGSFKVFMERGSKIVKEHVNNEIGAMVDYTGKPPMYVVPPLVPMEVYRHLETLEQKAFAQAGISLMSASSQKPVGLDSGRALRTFNDIESERFQTVGRRYEAFFLELARLSIATARTIAKREKSYPVRAPGKDRVEMIDWTEIDLTEDDYVMECFPTNALPNEPAGRLQTVQELMQAGLITPQAGRRLLAFPDLAQEESLADAQEDLIQRNLDAIVDGDGTPASYTRPEPYDDLVLARRKALEYHARGRAQGLEPEKIVLLERYITQIDDLEAEATQAAQAQAQMTAPPGAPPAEALPPGTPLAPPVAPAPSPLVANTPPPPMAA